MNAISAAMQDAGVKLPPLSKRVWLWLHDHPEKTSKDVSVALNVRQTDTATILGSMMRRGMVTRTSAPLRTRSNGRHTTVFVWRTCIREYELLPPRKHVAAVRAEIVAKEKATPEISPTPTVKDFDMESCTLRELRALYRQLKELFE